ncbi:condensin complex subunit [Perilla frutescens var. hirtella]|uniref:Condensin complex subunit 2 n=1 Tax=Perilla frutescens var. hirtella TaxID=608512 RepID=A0AAD4PEB6_PERFH|nr:condensin complex subunit [Perilla frutescens var. hirtella]
MAETLSPNSKQRAPFSPIKSPFAIGSNNDKLERAQARAARAAAIRRKPTVLATSVLPETDSCLGKEQILDLFHNCIKLASENKINQKNTWELNLIDHLCEIIKVEEEDDTETNFQKASCTLEAGVKIYSMRVDSVHSEAYKVLGGINRVGQEDEKDHATEDGNVSSGPGENDEKKEQGRKLSPLSTLESSFAAINVKKFDVAFVVDPLYHQTSAQFDEGGAKGLLLNNLGVYGNCQVLFDSSEVPGKSSSQVAQEEGAQIIDISFASECIERMVSDMLNSTEISPSLGAIVNQLDTDDRRQSESHSFGQVNESLDKDDDVDADTFGNYEAWDFDHDDQASVVDEATHNQDTMFSSQDEVPYMGDEQSNVYDPDEDDRSEEVDSYLFLSLGFSTKQNAWAGPNHWKFRKVKDPEVLAEENGSPKSKKTRTKKADLDIDFSNAIDTDVSLIFAPPKNPKTLLLPASRAPCNTRLPEDCHYQPEDLVKLFLLPHVLCLGKTRRKKTDGESQQIDGFEATTSWDDGDDFGGAFHDGHAYSDVEEPSTLVSQPRQVSKIEVQYDKTSKQVDVHVLKETLWGHMQQLNHSPVEEEATEESISFKQVLASFPDNCRAAGSLNDISSHLCFICLLHLANEHGLQILGCPSLDDLSIHLKPHK